MTKTKTIRKKALIPKVTSLLHLRAKANEDARYAKLAILAAKNLGGAAESIDGAMRWLYVNAAETESEEGGGEEGVVAEINGLRDLL